MQVHYSMDFIPVIDSPVVTVGSFDGVHVGHRAIIGRLKALAEQVKGSSVLVTFHPHPRRVLYPDTLGKDLKLINSPSEKISLLEEVGLDHLIIMEFTRDFARTSSDDFVKIFLVEKLRAHTIVVGFNHYFGYNREGSFASLYKSGERLGFRVEEIPQQEIQNETVSSTRIRRALKEGNIQRANAYLEHHYMIRAKLEALPYQHGRPCFQIPIGDPLKLLPPAGGYAASFHFNGHYEKALVYVKEDSVLLFPLDAGTAPGPGEEPVRFHKRLAGTTYPDIRSKLHEVKELIY